jgi:predicted HAD superfamily Cof-like phosphohydrolase
VSAMSLRMLQEEVCDALEAWAAAPGAIVGTDPAASNLRRTLRNLRHAPGVRESLEARALARGLRPSDDSTTETDDRSQMVREFFVRVVPHEERHDAPTVPSERTIRFRLDLLGEEFVELLDEAYDDRAAIDQLRAVLSWFRDVSPVRKDLARRLPGLVKEAVDVAYSAEALLVSAGVDGSPVFRLVNASNMAKEGGPLRPNDGKLLKPPGWTPPDVAGELRRQGLAVPREGGENASSTSGATDVCPNVPRGVQSLPGSSERCVSDEG